MTRALSSLGFGLGWAVLAGCGNTDDGLRVYNLAPLVSIQTPVDGASFNEGDAVPFDVVIGDDDPLDELSVTIQSSISGNIATDLIVDASGHAQWITSTLEAGEHTIVVRAFDAAAASGDASVKITVVDLPERPSVAFVHPDILGTEKGLEGYPFVFQVQVSDHQDLAEDLQVQLLANPYGVLCSTLPDGSGMAQCSATLPLGFYTLSVSVTDSDNNTASVSNPFSVVSRGDFDADGDGVSPNGGDCNDSSPTIYPGADELCDGLDNDCNALTAIDVGTECFDDDRDGYCEEPPCVNTANTLSDCDDANPARYPNPAIVEMVNGRDDDCDGLIDEGTTAYDDDGDGFCEVPPCRNVSGSTAASPDDCNDGDAGVNPGIANEICGDGKDNDCDGLANERNAVGCRNFYYDADGDTYGISGSTQCWCDAGQSPYTGLNTTDCYDSNNNAFPGQTAYFPVHRGDNKYDYNCNSSDEKQYTGTSSGCRWQVEPFQCELKTGAGWVGSVPSCGQDRTYTSDCSGSYDVGCYALCAWLDPTYSCFSSCDNSCESDSTTMKQSCR